MFCRQCGFELSDNDLFCAKCGAQIYDVEKATDSDVNTVDVSVVDKNDSLSSVSEPQEAAGEKSADSKVKEPVSIRNILITIKPILILFGVFAVLAFIIFWAKKASDASKQSFREEYREPLNEKGTEDAELISKSESSATINNKLQEEEAFSLSLHTGTYKNGDNSIDVYIEDDYTLRCEALIVNGKDVYDFECIVDKNGPDHKCMIVKDLYEDKEYNNREFSIKESGEDIVVESADNKLDFFMGKYTRENDNVVSDADQAGNDSSEAVSGVYSSDDYPQLNIDSACLGSYFEPENSGYRFINADGIVDGYQGFTHVGDASNYYKCIETGEYFGVDYNNVIIAYSAELRNGSMTLCQCMGWNNDEWDMYPEPKVIQGPGKLHYAVWKISDGYLLVGIMNNPGIKNIRDDLVMSHYCQVSKKDYNKFLLWDSMTPVNTSEEQTSDNATTNASDNKQSANAKSGTEIKSPQDIIPCRTTGVLSRKGHSEYILEDVYDESDCIYSAEKYFDTCGYKAVKTEPVYDRPIIAYKLYEGDKQIATVELCYRHINSNDVYLIIDEK